MLLTYLMPILMQMRGTLLAVATILTQNLVAANQPPPVQASDAPVLGVAAQADQPIVPVRKADAQEPPQLTAQAIYLLEPENSTLLYAKNPNGAQSPASTTKIMTALVALQEYSPSDIVTVSLPQAAIGQTAELINGEQLRVEDLLYAMMIHSGNDAALALAQYHPQGYRHFINLMNQQTVTLGLTNSHFANVSGVDSPGHYVSARDLAEITRAALQTPLFRQIVATPSHTIKDQRGWYQHELVNLNELLGKVPGVMGVKTGWTPVAGECLVSLVDRGDHQLITVVLGSQDRFGETEKLIEWVYQNYEWKSLSEAEKSMQ